MKFHRFFFIFLYSYSSLYSSSLSSPTAVYSSLNPHELQAQLAFYHLYPHTPEGESAKEKLLCLLCKHQPLFNPDHLPSLPILDVQSMVQLLYEPTSQRLKVLPTPILNFIDELCYFLPNRKLEGHSLWDIEHIIALPSEKIDLARALLLVDGSHSKEEILTYEAFLDWIALGILAKLDRYSPPEEKIAALNQTLFYEMGYRFPPKSLSVSRSEQYSSISFLLDQRHGICLGVSLLYYAIAQRIGLDLIAYTPPGHIFLSWDNPNGKPINIETTARGIDIPIEYYLNINTISFDKYGTKPMIGFYLTNIAAQKWHEKKFHEALALYEKSIPFRDNEMQFDRFLAYLYVLTKQDKKAQTVLSKWKKRADPTIIQDDLLLEDYFDRKIDLKGIELLFSSVEDRYEDKLLHQQKLKELVDQFPLCLQALYQLAASYLNLGQIGPSINYLEKLLELAPSHLHGRYLLMQIYLDRGHYQKAWQACLECEKILLSHQHHYKPFFKQKSYLCDLFPPFLRKASPLFNSTQDKAYPLTSFLSWE